MDIARIVDSYTTFGEILSDQYDLSAVSVPANTLRLARVKGIALKKARGLTWVHRKQLPIFSDSSNLRTVAIEGNGGWLLTNIDTVATSLVVHIPKLDSLVERS